jgi:hypothetical protein
MATWLVRRPGYAPAKYMGTTTKKGVDYYQVRYTWYTYKYFLGKDYFSAEWKVSECELYRSPGKWERKIRKWLKYRFHLVKLKIDYYLEKLHYGRQDSSN